MGYFSNGTEGELYEARYCTRCVHGPLASNEDKPCPVMMAHFLFAHEECNSRSNCKKTLDMLIPPHPTEPWNDECAMFVPRERLEKGKP